MPATIYTSADAPYFTGLMALLNSIKYYGVDLPIIVSDMGLTPEQRAWTETKAKVVPGWKPTVPLTTDRRFLAYQAKAENVRMSYDGGDIVFLDSDIILCDDIRDKFPGGLVTHDLVIQRDIFDNDWSKVHKDVIPTLPSSCPGFNCGQYAMSARIAPDFLDRWCALQAELLKRVPHHQIRFGPDQDSYNMLLYTIPIKKLVMAAPVWYQHEMQRDLGRPGKSVVELSAEGRYQLRFTDYDCTAKLVHFAGMAKPWTIARNHHPAASLQMFDHMLALDLREADNPKLAADALFGPSCKPIN